MNCLREHTNQRMCEYAIEITFDSISKTKNLAVCLNLLPCGPQLSSLERVTKRRQRGRLRVRFIAARTFTASVFRTGDVSSPLGPTSSRLRPLAKQPALTWREAPDDRCLSFLVAVGDGIGLQAASKEFNRQIKHEAGVRELQGEKQKHAASSREEFLVVIDPRGEGGKATCFDRILIVAGQERRLGWQKYGGPASGVVVGAPIRRRLSRPWVAIRAAAADSSRTR